MKAPLREDGFRSEFFFRWIKTYVWRTRSTQCNTLSLSSRERFHIQAVYVHMVLVKSFLQFQVLLCMWSRSQQAVVIQRLQLPKVLVYAIMCINQRKHMAHEMNREYTTMSKGTEEAPKCFDTPHSLRIIAVPPASYYWVFILYFLPVSLWL